MPHPLHDEWLESARGRLISVMRAGPKSVDEIATQLELTGNAVRAQLAVLQRDGLVQPAGKRRGVTRPTQLYELTPALEQLLSRAYIPLLTQLVHLWAQKESPASFNSVMRQAGRGLAAELAPHPGRGPLGERMAAASTLLNRELGATTRVEKENGSYVIRGDGCPLSSLTGKHRGVCLAIESLVGEVVGGKVAECCDRDARPRCCFRAQRGARGS